MFFLVPAHPGFPGQIPQSRKTVVCVCVCLDYNQTAYLCRQLLVFYGDTTSTHTYMHTHTHTHTHAHTHTHTYTHTQHPAHEKAFVPMFVKA